MPGRETEIVLDLGSLAAFLHGFGQRTLALKLYGRFKGKCEDLPPLLDLLEDGGPENV